MSKFQIKDKFIVINKKRLEELNDHANSEMFQDCKPVAELIDALNNFTKMYEECVGKLDQEYWVCNKDESYAGRVIDVIRAGEGG